MANTIPLIDCWSFSSLLLGFAKDVPKSSAFSQLKYKNKGKIVQVTSQGTFGILLTFYYLLPGCSHFAWFNGVALGTNR